MPTAASIAAAMLDLQDKRAAAEMIKTRSQFFAMKPAAQMQFVKTCGKLTD